MSRITDDFVSIPLVPPFNLSEFTAKRIGRISYIKGDIGTMPSNQILFVTAIALGFGVAGASAAGTEFVLRADGSVPASSLVPVAGGFSSGFSALKATKGSNLTTEASSAELLTGSSAASNLVRPEGAWADGLAALSASYLTSKSAASDVDARQTAIVLQEPQAANPKGLAALKTQSSQPGQSNEDLQGLRSQGAGPEVSKLLAAPSK
jgi:hypothetical protein